MILATYSAYISQRPYYYLPLYMEEQDRGELITSVYAVGLDGLMR